MKSRLSAISSNISTFIIGYIPVFKSCPPCAICMPKYAALFGFFGLKLADYSYYLQPLMGISMLISIGSMLIQVNTKNAPVYPVIGATISCTILFLSKYIADNFWITQIAMLGLLCFIGLHYHTLSGCASNKINTCS